MYKQHLLQNIEREILLLKQLSKVIQEKDLDFRPNEKVRSVFELMQYLSKVGSFALHWFLNGGVSEEEREKFKASRHTVNLSNFAAKLDEDLESIRKYMEQVSEEDLFKKEVELPSKEKMLLGPAIINGPIKWLVAYRMQLFYLLKLNGHSQLATRDAWALN